MFSIKGVYEKGSIRLLEPMEIEEETEVIITFLDEDPDSDEDPSSDPLTLPSYVEKEGAGEEYYKKIRKHKRFKAKGKINLLQNEEEISYPLNDYSAGGLSFISDQVFDINQQITATLKYTASGEILAMRFDIEVKRVVLLEEEQEEQYKIGCQFLDQVDEELWHMIME